MVRFWEKEKVMIKERSFSLLLALEDNDYKIIHVKRFLYRSGGIRLSNNEYRDEYGTSIMYKLVNGKNELTTCEYALTDEQHEKLIEEISKKIKCIVIGK